MAPRTFLSGDHRLARAVLRPVHRFLEVEAAGGVVLIGAVVLAVAWASSPWSASYVTLWHTDLHVTLGDRSWGGDLHHWVGEVGMVLFFFVIGLELKLEAVDGRLADRRAALAPIAGALGGMALPAFVFLALNAGRATADGWAVPMATDVAFAVGVLTLLGSRAPRELRALLLALAVIDDLGAVIVIAVFYSDGVDLVWLAVAVLGVGAILVLQRARVWWTPVYLAIGLGVWAATVASGVHATLAGVALGLVAPARPLVGPHEVRALGARLERDPGSEDERTLQSARFTLRESTSVASTLQHLLHPWTAFVIVPLFALANAGVPLSLDGLHDVVTTRLGGGIVAGLVLGKALGVAGGILLVVRAGWATLPRAVGSREVVGLGAIAGIGFTVSLFIAGLAFSDPAQLEAATLAILTASVLAAAVGATLLGARSVRRSPAPPDDDRSGAAAP